MQPNRQPAPGQGESGEYTRASEASRLLGVPVDTLGVWHDEFGYPQMDPASGGEPRYASAQVHALRHALMRELSIAAAIRSARAVAPERSHGGGSGRPASDAHS
jgi:hypothetical protein